MEKEKVLKLVSSNQKKEDQKKDSVKELLEGILLEMSDGNLQKITQACVILVDETDAGHEEMIMLNTDLDAMRMVGILEMMKLRYIEVNS